MKTYESDELGRVTIPENDDDKGEWVPACNETEKPFKTKSGIRLLYCYNPTTGNHAYMNVDADTILTDEEAFSLLP